MKATVKDVMSGEVVAVRRGASFKEMAASLRRYRISAFPVIDDDGKVIGVVSEADLLAKEALADGQAGNPGAVTGLLHHKQHEKAEALTAGDMMTHPAVTVRPDDTVEHAARMMYTLQVKRLPVVDAGGHLIGIVSRSDLLAVFDRPDSEILAEITDDVILHELLIDPAMFIVTVRDGVVTIQGNPESANLGHELVNKIRQVRGVVAVRDELVYPPADRSIAGLYY
ncbi:MAG TPA: CBS domain-containing protein [Streptosporangiaceae bacterium]|nr:CBS domain-containing protein [Streptosporangiaceae bacterium]